MINEIKTLWRKKYEPQGRINITVFFINIFLLLCHVFLMAVYLIIGHKFMIYTNIISLLVYLISVPICYKNIERYMGIAFLEIWLHLICGILAFGWTPCYQNWCFGMIVAYFLPVFSSDNNKNTVHRPFYYAFLIIFTYFFLATFLPLTNFKITIQLSIELNSVLFIANNLFTFVAITLFAMFYTSKTDRREKELTRKADYDELTSLYNRHALNQLSEKIIKAAKENEESYSVAIMDIDFFKKVNDKYGHTSGDMVLKQLANIIRSFTVKGIIPGRWGGEEFILIAPHNMDYDEFREILEKLRVRVKNTKFRIEKKKEIKLTISIGAVPATKQKDLEEAVGDADINLYKAKESGRNRLIA